MDITVYGSGYVGLVVAACFAQTGNHVLCMDIDANKVAMLSQGQVPIYEPGLAQVFKECQDHIRFTTDPRLAAEHGKIQFIAVGTPGDGEGRVSLEYVEQVSKNIAQYINQYTVVVNKSTVPVGAATQVSDWIRQGLVERGANIPFEVVANPEFLRQGNALEDFRQPDRIIVGAESDHARELMQTLYAPFDPHHNKLMLMGVRSAELCKYASNAFLATKISFINQIANLAETVDADIEEVRIGMGRDRRIGPDFLQAGCGYGGSCFGKDSKALLHIAHDHDISLDVIEASERANLKQKERMVKKLDMLFGQNLTDKVFAIWGLSFKPGTDDMRDATSLVVLKALHERGAITQVYDPQAMQNAKHLFAKQSQCVFCETKEQALEGAMALLVLTEWPDFKQPDFHLIKSQLLQPIILDGRNIFSLKQMQQHGIQYYGVGRSAHSPSSIS